MKRIEVRDLMTTAIITANAKDPVSGAHAEMQVGVIHHLPVVDDRGKLVGVLSDRDILRSLGHRPAKKVGDVMTRDVVTIHPNAPAYQAAQVMLDEKIGSVLVVDDDGALIGMVTQTDYLDVARRALLSLPLER